MAEVSGGEESFSRFLSPPDLLQDNILPPKVFPFEKLLTITKSHARTVGLHAARSVEQRR